MGVPRENDNFGHGGVQRNRWLLGVVVAAVLSVAHAIPRQSAFMSGLKPACQQAQRRRSRSFHRNRSPLFVALFSNDSLQNDVVLVGGERALEEENDEKRSLPPTSRIKGIVFDMDGTLVKHVIDFAEMRRRVYEVAAVELNCSVEEMEGQCVLELEKTLVSPKAQLGIRQVFGDIERKAVKDMALMDGLDTLCQYLDACGIRRAIVTRNVERNVHLMQDLLWTSHGIPNFYPIVARDTVVEDTLIPYKPAPDAIHYICQQWNCDTREVLMVGDSAADDIAAGNRAGCGGSVLLQSMNIELDNDSGGGVANSELEVREQIPTVTVPDLPTLQRLLLLSNERKR
eukprot:scaffold125979_cov52-Attheya_sp.AAC.4